MVAMGWFVAGGICERFPELTVVFLEGSGGWCAPMLERFDHHVDVFGSRYQTTPPSEVFKRQCYISFDPDEEALAYTANSKYVGADRIVWASDYPAPRRQDPRHRARARGGDGGARARAAPPDLRRECQPASTDPNPRPTEGVGVTHQPMEGVKVVEVAQFTFTPGRGRGPRRLGRRRIKVEHAVHGRRPARPATRHRGAAAGSFQPLMEHPNRGKRSIGLALENPAAYEVLLELVRDADVFLTNFLPDRDAG